MKRIFYIILISVLFIPYSYSKNLSGFVIENENNKFNLQPIAKSYKGKTPKISLNNSENIKIIIFSHGTTRPKKKEKCKRKYNSIPNSLFSLSEIDNVFFYYLCSKATDGNNPGSYIIKRVKEIENVLDQLLDNGIKPKNIFLSGVSAGGWSSLMLMQKVGKKFNSAIVFAPACCGPRHEINKYPKWRKEIRPNQVKQIENANSIKALIFAYEDDKFNRSKELMFLKEKSPETVKLIEYKCGEGHNTYRKDCKIDETKKIIKKYIEEQG
ncbi:hypothetical protein N8700_05615 [Candidatus Pelagibacter sp.]|nr:hypothetical protein [Candidatus Pelagibacter sp.]